MGPVATHSMRDTENCHCCHCLFLGSRAPPPRHLALLFLSYYLLLLISYNLLFFSYIILLITLNCNSELRIANRNTRRKTCWRWWMLTFSPAAWGPHGKIKHLIELQFTLQHMKQYSWFLILLTYTYWFRARWFWEAGGWRGGFVRMGFMRSNRSGGRLGLQAWVFGAGLAGGDFHFGGFPPTVGFYLGGNPRTFAWMGLPLPPLGLSHIFLKCLQ